MSLLLSHRAHVTGRGEDDVILVLAKDIKADRDHSTSSVMVLFTSTAFQKPLQLSPPHLFSSASIL